MSNDLHSGHRQRLRARLLEQGISKSTPPHEILEFILFHSIPRKDTNELAHELIARFGSLAGVFDAPINELMKVKGINKNTITLLKLFMPIARVYIDEKLAAPKDFRNIDEVGHYLLKKHIGYTNEVLSVMSLNAKGKLLSYDIIAEGSLNEVAASRRKIVELAMAKQAHCVVLCHNHPGGFAVPTAADLKITALIQDSLLNFDIALLDHIILSDDDYVSLFQSAEYKDLFIR
ncbi:MAG: hypothetical protein IJP22_04220 [Clostridia bacterium]|nr:hypothetical protein [Clostridia bacterium]